MSEPRPRSDMVEVLLTDSDEHLWRRLMHLLRPAKTLDITSAFFSAHELLVELATRVSIRILVRPEFPTSGSAVLAAQAAANVEIRGLADHATPLHQKVFLARNHSGSEYGAYVGSANWTSAGLTKNREAGVWLRSPDSLEHLRRQFETLWPRAAQITTNDIARMREGAKRSYAIGKPRGTLTAAWRTLAGSTDAVFFLKHNGTGDMPFREGATDFCDKVHDYSAQTFSAIPSALRPGQGMLLTWISRRKDDRPDRLVYGRGRVAGYDRAIWRLPYFYVEGLRSAGVPQHKIARILRWPYIVWLDPVEIIAYPRSCVDYLWLRDAGWTDFRSFRRRGISGISKQAWDKCNCVLDELTLKYGLRNTDHLGIWWNDQVEILDPDNALYLTKSRIEELNRKHARK